MSSISRWPNDSNAGPTCPCWKTKAIAKAALTPDDQKLLTKQYTEHAVDFIRDHADKPFFVYLAHSMVHVPLFVSDEFAGSSGAGLFGDVVTEIDWSVGEVLDALEETGVADNTLILFTSDNGPWLSYGTHAGSAEPLREGKGTSFEGGFRVPAIMRWPGRIPAGTVCNELAATIDILPTFAALIGAELPSHTIDGKDIAPLMFGPAKRNPRTTFTTTIMRITNCKPCATAAGNCSSPTTIERSMVEWDAMMGCPSTTTASARNWRSTTLKTIPKNW